MAVIAVRCPYCDRDKIVRRGKTNNGKQRYLCQNEACSQRTFILDYTNRGYLPSVKRQIIDLALNGSGIRDTARVLRISTDTVLSELKKRNVSLSQSTECSYSGRIPTTGKW
jgi:insertion element IS1 protein InsB